ARICPRILMKCKKDSDCLAECICEEHGFCG
uniref:Trypsin inhibitor 6 n=1 Tax=Cyclanthera pedata TaxID=198836 RepID=ITR6_CYCPE|nr:RecName: Full=Trypsin inhibitor 6; AltName: Full=CyPTI-VI; AltName: Full=Trypsin inhibitor VI [Cyclanthera pedata]